MGGRLADTYRGEGAGGRRFVSIRHARLGEGRLGDVTGLQKFLLADRIELERAVVRVGDHDDRRMGRGALDRRVRIVRQPFEDRHVGQCREQASRQHDLLAANAVGQAAEDDEEWRGDQQRPCHQQVGWLRRHLEHLRQEEQRIELSAIHLQEDRRLGQLQAYVDRDRQQQDRHQERYPPSPGIECLSQDVAADQDDQQAQEQAQGGRRLDPAGIEAPPAVRSARPGSSRSPTRAMGAITPMLA